MAGTPAAEIAVSIEQVRGLLADQHPAFSVLPISFAGEGWDNFTYRLGNVLAMRMPRRQASVQLLVNGFVKDVLQELPMEFAVEAQKLISISLEGSVG